MTFTADARSYRLFSTGLFVAAIAAAILAPSPAAFAAQECASLAALKIDNTNLLSATEVPASDDLPAYCRVLGYVRPAINFEIRLPAREWNGKFYMVGCGVYCGVLSTDRPGFVNTINFGLKRNYAVATSDGGHWGAVLDDARWALNNPVAVMDWGQRSVPETTRVAKVLLKSYYGIEQRKAYYVGCSNGGRMGLMEALRYPQDFDGIVAGAPALDFSGLVGTLYEWVQQANTAPDGKPVLPPDKVKLLGAAVHAACGERIGTREPVIADPRACDFKPSTLQCRAGDAADCLTAAQVRAVEKIYGGPVDSRGRRLFPGGIPIGSELYWPTWVTGDGVKPGRQAGIVDNFYEYMAPSRARPSFERTGDEGGEGVRRLSELSSIIDAAKFNPLSAKMEFGDLEAFRRHGGKLVLYHGWADAAVTPQPTVDFYEALAKKSGGMTSTREFARLFMVPSMDHCGLQPSGPGIADTGIDPLTALENWVEHDRAPDELIATKLAPDGKQTLWQRPVCAYPQAARYTGNGNPADASNFACHR